MLQAHLSSRLLSDLTMFKSILADTLANSLDVSERYTERRIYHPEKRMGGY